MRGEDQAWLELGLELLPAVDRYVIVCRPWEEQPFVDIAATLGTSEDATRMRFRRALARLGRVLASLRSGQRGDLVVITQLIVPRKLTDQQRTLLSDYAETEDLEVATAKPSLWDKIRDAVTGG